MMKDRANIVPSIFITHAGNGASSKANALSVRPMRERTYSMSVNFHRAYDVNDAVLERIYISRRSKPDTARWKKLFETYTKMAPKKMTAR